MSPAHNNGLLKDPSSLSPSRHVYTFPSFFALPSDPLASFSPSSSAPSYAPFLRDQWRTTSTTEEEVSAEIWCVPCDNPCKQICHLGEFLPKGNWQILSQLRRVLFREKNREKICITKYLFQFSKKNFSRNIQDFPLRDGENEIIVNKFYPKLNETDCSREKISANRLRRCRYYTRVRVQSPEKGSYTRAGRAGRMAASCVGGWFVLLVFAEGISAFLVTGGKNN